MCKWECGHDGERNVNCFVEDHLCPVSQSTGTRRLISDDVNGVSLNKHSHQNESSSRKKCILESTWARENVEKVD